MTQKLQHDVLVRKDIKLATGESVHEFTQALSNDVRKFVRQKLNMDVQKSDVYVIDVFSTAAVVEVYKFGPNVDSSDRRKFYAMKFDRKDTGSFDFSNMIEVERVTSFRAKQSAIAKSADEVDVEKAPIPTARINDLPDAAFAIIKPGGKKDASGKTVPRSLRMLPHHTSGVKSPTENTSIDLPHLRNALARVSQADLTPEQRSRAQAHLNAHAKAVLPSRGGKKPVKKALDVCDGWTETSKSFWNGVL